MILKRCGVSSYPLRTSMFVVSTINPFFASLSPLRTIHGISSYPLITFSCRNSFIARYLRFPDKTSHFPPSSIQTVSGVKRPYRRIDCFNSGISSISKDCKGVSYNRLMSTPLISVLVNNGSIASSVRFIAVLSNSLICFLLMIGYYKFTCFQ